MLLFAVRAGLRLGARALALFTLLAVLSAAAGGILFVLSGFQNDGFSAQMGGSFLSAYAAAFLTLYFARGE